METNSKSESVYKMDGHYAMPRVLDSMFFARPHWMGLLAVFIYLLIVPRAPGAFINAASPSASDVQAAINKATNGDTVTVPAGSATWTTQVISTNYSITIQGAGIGQTIISSTTPGEFIVCSGLTPGAAGLPTRITGFTFDDGGAVNDGFLAPGYYMRIDHCLFTNSALFLLVLYDYCGVVDHCTFAETDAGIFINNGTWGGSLAGYGDGAWTNADQWGTTNFAYIEDCTFLGNGPNGAMDGCFGARWVFRHNYVTNDILVAHGTDSTGRPRGTRAVEVYDNTFIAGTDFADLLELRSGTAVLYSNNCTGYNGNIVALKNFRSPSCNGSYNSQNPYPPWGLTTGSNPYDGNTDTNGYPAIDQCGRGAGDLMVDTYPGSGIPIDSVTGKTNWPNEVSDPVYQWGNVNNGSPMQVGTCSGLFVQGRDYFNNVVKPGYMALVYPYPLVTSESGSGSSSFTLTVVNGSGSGSYTNGAIVSIVANAANTSTNGAFAFWSGADIANTNSSSTTVTMPGSSLTVTANYAPNPPSNLKVYPNP